MLSVSGQRNRQRPLSAGHGLGEEETNVRKPTCFPGIVGNDVPLTAPTGRRPHSYTRATSPRKESPATHPAIVHPGVTCAGDYCVDHLDHAGAGRGEEKEREAELQNGNPPGQHVRVARMLRPTGRPALQPVPSFCPHPPARARRPPAHATADASEG